jgi:hypothetical protein
MNTIWKTNEDNPESKLRYCDVKKFWFVNLVDFISFCADNNILGQHGFLYDIMYLNGEIRLYSYKTILKLPVAE